MGVVLSNFRLTFSAVCAILPLSAQLLLWGFADAAYPREGTVTYFTAVLDVVAPMQLIPARGRLRLPSKQLPFREGCSLSPRGDGYTTDVRLLTTAIGCSLSPRGDGYFVPVT